MILNVDPKVDYAFKYLFGRESTKSILIEMLNSVLAPLSGSEIVDVELLNPFSMLEAPDDKLSILDISARDQSGRLFNIEMQMAPYPDYEQRALYYWAILYDDQLRAGDHYGMLRPTISINFLNHVRFGQVPDYHLQFHLREDKHHLLMTKDIEFHFLELPKFNKKLSELATALDRWLYFLKNAEKIDAIAVPPALEQPGIVRAIEVLQMLTQDQIERERYLARRKFQLDYNSGLIGAKEQGEQIGRELGMRDGLEAGKEIGLQAGKEIGLQAGKEIGLQAGKEIGLQAGKEIGLQAGKEIGLQAGKEIGELIGTIHVCQRVLRQTQTPKDQLNDMSKEELTRLAAELAREAGI